MQDNKQSAEVAGTTDDHRNNAIRKISLFDYLITQPRNFGQDTSLH